MPGRDTVELALGAVAGALAVVLAYGATAGDLDSASLGIAVVGLLIAVAAAALRRRRP